MNDIPIDVPQMLNITSDEEESSTSGKESLGTGMTGRSFRSDYESHMSTQTLTRMVFRTRILVLSVLVVMAVGCTIATYIFSKHVESDSLNTWVESYSNEIFSASQLNAKNIIESATALSIAITMYALDAATAAAAPNSDVVDWPFVTVPHFQTRAHQVLEASGARSIMLAPTVTDVERSEWESWSSLQENNYQDPITPYIFREGSPDGSMEREEAAPGEHYAPVWQLAPPRPKQINLNLLGNPTMSSVMEQFGDTRTTTATISKLNFMQNGIDNDSKNTEPFSLLTVPVHRGFEEEKENDSEVEVVALLTLALPWQALLANVVPLQDAPMDVVVRNTCGQQVTYRVNGTHVLYLGEGDLHDAALTNFENVALFSLWGNDDEDVDNENICSFSIHTYPTPEFRDTFQTNQPKWNATAVALIFIVTSSFFVVYDWFVQKYQRSVLSSAKRSNAIVSSLFPAQVRARLMAGDDGTVLSGARSSVHEKVNGIFHSFGSNEHHSKNVGFEDENEALLRTPPIADLFAHATVMFADICGFTAWSSVREPTQVFTLLEQIYNSFDAIAKRRKIFKVETIGDCYVAVAGLPEPRNDHAEVMARFSNECRWKMIAVVKRLEVLLGPDTSDLAMRFGLHSGPVTAGVLRGDKSRFQLFGDTVNTASRIETTGCRNMIHISEETAKCLEVAGKSHWYKAREGLVAAKGKGLIQTYWLTLNKGRGPKNVGPNGAAVGHKTTRTDSDTDSVVPCGDEDAVDEEHDTAKEREERLIDWITDVLHGQLKKIIAMRESSAGTPAAWSDVAKSWFSTLTHRTQEGRTVLDEVKEIIQLSHQTCDYHVDPETVVLKPDALRQLRSFVSEIAHMYHTNPFHSFTHATHVTMSVTKLLTRVVAPDSMSLDALTFDTQIGAQMHEFTYGITSDPLIQFACAFSALIHDVDHPGVPNAVLVKEETEAAQLYNYKSIAEQNSVDLAWGLLMEPAYDSLRQCIYTTQDELDRFRSLVVNSVMATDIADKELGAARKARWVKAFTPNTALDDDGLSPSGIEDMERQDTHRKATIVIEHIIQASDISHTMQHWHIYLKWNERFFHECYQAYAAGRTDVNPVDGWYQGEIGFYDFYIIPLAKKLKECGVFGVSSDEYLNYALENRREWQLKGEEIVAGYVRKYCNPPKDHDVLVDHEVTTIADLESAPLEAVTSVVQEEGTSTTKIEAA